MNKQYYLSLSVFLLSLFFVDQVCIAQDTDSLTVEWAGDDGVPIINSLLDAVLGDTTDTGDRANLNRVYKLRRGGFYFTTERITNSGFHLNIVGETGPAATNPAVIQKLNRDDGSLDDKLIVGQSDVTLKNILINGRSDQGNLPYEAIRFDAPDGRLVVDNVVMEHAQWGILAVYGKNSDVFITNSHFRNLISEAQKWGGRGMSIWTDVDTVYVENNTYFNIGAVPLQVEGGVANHLWFNHNTLVNVGRDLMWGSWWKEAYVTNNLIVNGFWHGEEETDFNPERLNQPSMTYAGMFNVRPLPAQYGLDIERQIAVVGNATFTDQSFVDWMANTSGDINPNLPDNDFGSIRAQPLIADSTMYFFDSWDNLVYDQHIEGEDPGFANHGADNFQSMTDFITALRNGDAEVPLWYWDPGRSDENISINWPVPEDLSYTNSTLMTSGLGGFPLGNLNAFPSQKAMWMDQQSALAEQIIGLVMPEGSAQLIVSPEAEDAVFDGDAAAMTPPDLLFADLRGSGSITWTFDLAAAGTFDVAIESRAEFGEKYQRLTVNGTEVVGSGGGGEAVHVVDNGAETWFDVMIPGVAFESGENTMAITPSWGFSNHRDARIIDPNTTDTVAVLSVVDAALDNISLKCGGDVCASGNEFVALGSGGLTFGFDLSSEGEYLMRVYYQAESDQTADVYVAGELVAMDVNFSATTGNWSSVDVPGLMLASGANQVQLTSTSGGLSVDLVDLFQIFGGTDTSTEENTLPEGYSLGENYPNPFNPTTTFTYQLGEIGDVRIAIYDFLGREIRELVNSNLPAGTYQARWDGTGSNGQLASSGIYFYRIETEVGQQSRRMVLLK